MCYDCKYTLPITKTDLEIEESSDEEFEDDEDFNDDYRIRIFVHIISPGMEDLPFEMETNMKSQYADVSCLSMYAQDLMHTEGHTSYEITEVYDSTDDFQLDDDDLLIDGHYYKIFMAPREKEFDEEDSDNQIRTYIQIDGELMNLLIKPGSTIIDVIKERMPHIVSINRIYKWTETFDEWSYVKRCYRVDNEDHFKVDGTIDESKRVYQDFDEEASDVASVSTGHLLSDDQELNEDELSLPINYEDQVSLPNDDENQVSLPKDDEGQELIADREIIYPSDDERFAELLVEDFYDETPNDHGRETPNNNDDDDLSIILDNEDGRQSSASVSTEILLDQSISLTESTILPTFGEQQKATKKRASFKRLSKRVRKAFRSFFANF